MFTPSMIRRFLSGSTFSTRPRLPRSLPVMIRTLSFLRSGVARRDTLENLRRERDDLHEPALAQLARDRTKYTGADRLVVVVVQHGGVAIEADVAAVAAALLLDRADDHRLDDLPLLDGALGRRLFHRRGDDVAQPRVAAGRSTDRVDDRDLACAGIVGDVQDRPHLDHDSRSSFVVLRSTRVVRSTNVEPRTSNDLITTLRPLCVPPA